MAISASIEVKVDYTLPTPPPTPAPPVPPASVSDNVPDVSNSSLSGLGDSSGASTDRTVPNQEGGNDNRQRKNPVPTGGTFTKATVIIKMTCEDGSNLSLTESGNVSASAKVEGNCITTTTVNRETTNHVTETKTVTKKKCCPATGSVLFALREELREFRQEVRELLQSSGRVVSSRMWLGIAVRPDDQGRLEIESVIANSPAAKASLQAGDRLMRVGEQAVPGIDALKDAISKLSPRHEMLLAILRGDQTLSVPLLPQRQIFRGNDVPGDVIEDKKCDANCRCTVDAPGAVCASYWKYRGDGPNDGVLYEMSCTAFGANNEVVSDTHCGLGEYF